MIEFGMFKFGSIEDIDFKKKRIKKKRLLVIEKIP